MIIAILAVREKTQLDFLVGGLPITAVCLKT